jgi:RNA polymerase sigma factor (TIGR02999 family)
LLPAMRYLLAVGGRVPQTVTMLLRDWRAGDAAAFAALLPIVYDELQRVAAAYLRGERPDHSMRAPDLVAEAYLRLAGSEQPEWQDRLHFFGIAARTMRQVLVDHARRRTAAKRGDGARPVTLDEALASTNRSEELIALDEALAALAGFDERKSRIVELHYFGGLTHNEVAELLGVHVRTVARDLRLAESWIHRRLRAAQ